MAQAFEKLHWAADVEVQEYLTPSTLEEALQLLAEHGGKAKVIAGGTDVIPQLRSRDYSIHTLVDITGLSEFDRIEMVGDEISIGGLVTHSQAAAAELLQDQAGLLVQGCASVGSPQIRNVATLAGNLVSGQPAADAAIPLLALDAKVTIASIDGERVVPLTEFFKGLGKTALDPFREILTKISFKALGAGRGGAYLRLAKRKALTLPMLVCGVVVEVDPDQKVFVDAAVALGPVAPTPFREKHTEEFLKGSPLSMETVLAAAENAVAQCTPRDSMLRGSCDYRQEMVKVFVKRGLLRAVEQAGCRLS